jgi:3-hydroxybutyryl-CoA dehydrogenase
MAKNSVAIVGGNRVAQELLELSRENGIEATLHSGPEPINNAATLTIETRAGDEEEKRRLLQALDATLPPSSVIVTSCLGFSTTTLASWISRPERVVGFATFYPIKEKKLIELAGGLRTQDGFFKQAESFFHALHKQTVRVRDAAGLTFPRVVSLIINEAARLLDEGVATAEEIDVAMRLGTGYPQGPLRWADQIGLNEVLAVLEGLHGETGDDRYRPAPLIKKMIQAGWLGEPAGRGFYSSK